MIGFTEQKVLNRYNINKYIIDIIINEYLYPKKTYLNELINLSKFYKLIFNAQAHEYFIYNKQTIYEDFKKIGLKCDFVTFKTYYLDYKELTIDIKTTLISNNIDINDKENITNLTNSFIQKIIPLFTDYYEDEQYIIINDDDDNNNQDNNIFSLDVIINGGIITRSYKSLHTSIHTYYDIIRNNYASQKVYVEVLESLESNINYELLNNNNIVNIFDLSYKEKLLIYMNL